MSDALEVPCTITKVTGEREESSDKKQEFCAVLKLTGRGSEKPTQAGDPASPTSRQEPEIEAVLLLPINTSANINDMLEVEGVKLRVTNIDEIRDAVGKLDYYRVEAMKWK